MLGGPHLIAPLDEVVSKEFRFWLTIEKLKRILVHAARRWRISVCVKARWIYRRRFFFFFALTSYMRRLALLRLRFFLSYCCCLLDRLGETLFLRCGGNGLCGWH